MYNPWTETKAGIARGNGDTGWRGTKGENWDNCNNIINKLYLKKEIANLNNNEILLHTYWND